MATCNKALGTAVIGGTQVPITCGKVSGHDTAPGNTNDQKAHGDPVYGTTLILKPGRLGMGSKSP